MKTWYPLLVTLVLCTCGIMLQPAFASPMGRAHRELPPPYYYMVQLTTNVPTMPILPGSGLYRVNSIVTIKATPTLIGIDGAVLQFRYWKGDYSGNSTVAKVKVTGDLFIVAVYS